MAPSPTQTFPCAYHQRHLWEETPTTPCTQKETNLAHPHIYLTTPSHPQTCVREPRCLLIGPSMLVSNKPILPRQKIHSYHNFLHRHIHPPQLSRKSSNHADRICWQHHYAPGTHCWRQCHGKDKGEGGADGCGFCMRCVLLLCLLRVVREMVTFP